MNEDAIKKTVEDLIDTFLYAGKVALELRRKGLIKEIKSDNTPVSNGDIEVNKLITQKINQINPDIPIISEETSDNRSNNNLKNFWLIDPIDGTYDYINDLEEFTINAGLIIIINLQLDLFLLLQKTECFTHMLMVLRLN